MISDVNKDLRKDTYDLTSDLKIDISNFTEKS